METLYETAQISVYKNPSDEIFVKNKASGVTIRISDVGKDLRTSSNSPLIPGQINGLSCFTAINGKIVRNQ